MKNIFLDKRFLVNGKKSVLGLDNPFNITSYIKDLIYLFSVTCAKNGLTVQSSLHPLTGVQLNCVELGGMLTNINTEIDGDGINERNLNFGINYPLSSFNINVNKSNGLGVVNIFADEAINLINSIDNVGIKVSPLLNNSSGINLITKNIINNDSLNDDIFTLVDQSSGEGEWKRSSYLISFLASDWIAGSYTIPTALHQQGAFPIIQIRNDSSGYLIVGSNTLGVTSGDLTTIEVASNGDVTLTGNPFPGTIKIKS